MCLFVAGGIFATVAGATAANAMIVSLASSALTIRQQSQNAKAMAQHQQQQYDLQAEVSRADAINKYAALNDQSREREIATSHSLLENRRKALEAGSLTEVMAEEGGIKGKSVRLALADVEKQNQDFQMALIQQKKFHDAQFIRQGEGIQTGEYAALLSAAPDPIPPPDYWGAAAGAAKAGFGTYNQFRIAGLVT